MSIRGVASRQGNVKVSFTLLNWIHNTCLSKNPPFPPFEKGENRKSPFVKGDLEGFSAAKHHFDETLRKAKTPLTQASAPIYSPRCLLVTEEESS